VVFGPWQKQLVAVGIWLVLIGAYFMIHPIFKVAILVEKYNLKFYLGVIPLCRFGCIYTRPLVDQQMFSS